MPALSSYSGNLWKSVWGGDDKNALQEYTHIMKTKCNYYGKVLKIPLQMESVLKPSGIQESKRRKRWLIRNG
jgi:hypothetical protein